MDFKNYQLRARTTDQYPDVTWPKDGPDKEPQKNNVIPLLGLVGEVGGLLSEYKKMLRDGTLHEEFPKQASEELGDILWYVAAVATKFDLSLEQIAIDNLRKTEDRWHEPGKKKPLYDKKLPVKQRLPRKFSYIFSHKKVKGEQRLVITDAETREDLGAALRDNAYKDDGYRFHDIMHLSFAVHLGWSPVWRKLLRDNETRRRPKRMRFAKRKPHKVDDVQDGGRAQVIDEGIVHAAYVYADQHHFLEGVKAVDFQILRHIKQMTARLEVSDRSEWEWNKTLIDGFRIWRKLRQHNGGTVTGDLLTNTLTFTPPV